MDHEQTPESHEGNELNLDQISPKFLQMLYPNELMALAAKGNADAEAALGDRLSSEAGELLYWHNKSADCPPIDCYPKLIEASVAWYRLAVKHGSIYGMAQLANALSGPDATPTELTEAKYWAEIALSQGEKSAAETVAHIATALMKSKKTA